MEYSDYGMPYLYLPLYLNKAGLLQFWSYDYIFSAEWSITKEQYLYFSNPDNGFTDEEEIIIHSIDELLSFITKANIQIGDLLYFENDKDGIHHATIISGITDDDILYAAHSAPRFDASLKKKLGEEIAHIILLNDH